MPHSSHSFYSSHVPPSQLNTVPVSATLNLFTLPSIFLDLDETLIYSSEKNINFDFKIGSYKVIKRNGLNELLTFLLHSPFRVSIWSAGTEDYVNEIIENINTTGLNTTGLNIPEINTTGTNPNLSAINSTENSNSNILKLNFEHILSRNKCTPRDDYYIKDIKSKFKKAIHRKDIDLKRTLIIDNFSLGCQRNYGNLIEIPDFYGEQDLVLFKLIDYLKWILNQNQDWRTIDKRNWLKEKIENE